MKKLFTLWIVAMMLPFALGALTLQPNQLIMGHYTTDDIDLENGWGKTFFKATDILPIATDITPDELALFKGSQIVAFRVGLTQTAPVTRVFVMPVGTDGKPTGEVTEWLCDVSSPGWNLIELEAPYTINLPEGYSLRIGFDYQQLNKNDTPISVVPVGDEYYKAYIYRGSSWMNYGTCNNGNLSLQCICENDNFQLYIMRTTDLTCSKLVQTGEDVAFSFNAYNLGTTAIQPGELTFNVAIDGQVVKTITNPMTITSDIVNIPNAINTAGVPAGVHTLTVTAVAVNGVPLAEPAAVTAQFRNYDDGFKRQMRLVEQFTSTTCTWCPQGTANILELTQMRDDIAWVAIHNTMPNHNIDPFSTDQTDSITVLEGINAFPEGTFDRTPGLESASYISAVISELPASTMSSFFDYVAELDPSWATVNVNSTFDPATRKAVITIDGELVPDFESIMGADSRLTVYITEDNLVYPQTNGGDDYVHNHVLRKALVSANGVALNKTGDTYKNEFTYTIPSTWKADNLNIIAFISRPLGNPLTDLYVTNANKRKLGEYDEPVTVPGDVDGDGMVNIDDLTALIDMLLKGGTAAGGDVDGDGIVSIDDVTALIDYLLKDTW